MKRIYLYGMTIRTNGFLLKGDFPKPDNYAEVRQRYTLPGAETGTAAIILAALNCKVKIDGNHQGKNTGELIKGFYGKIGVDISSLCFDPDYDGIEEFVMIDSDTRTIFSTFASYFEDYYKNGIVRWNTPKEGDIKGADAAGIDPFFAGESILAAKYCNGNNIPFVTVDEKPEHEICRLASIIAVSSDYVRDFMPGYYSVEGKARLIQKYAEHTGALVIITGGGGMVYYGRGGRVKEFPAFKVDVISTAGAGDTFKAGCAAALAQGYDDDKTVRFASALAAIACTKFPLNLNPPTLSEVMELYAKDLTI